MNTIKEKLLVHNFPDLLKYGDLPITIHYTQKFTTLIEGQEVVVEPLKLKFHEVEDYHSNNVQPKGGHYKPISKFVDGVL